LNPPAEIATALALSPAARAAFAATAFGLVPPAPGQPAWRHHVPGAVVPVFAGATAAEAQATRNRLVAQYAPALGAALAVDRAERARVPSDAAESIAAGVSALLAHGTDPAAPVPEAAAALSRAATLAAALRDLAAQIAPGDVADVRAAALEFLRATAVPPRLEATLHAEWWEPARGHDQLRHVGVAAPTPAALGREAAAVDADLADSLGEAVWAVPLGPTERAALFAEYAEEAAWRAEERRLLRAREAAHAAYQHERGTLLAFVRGFTADAAPSPEGAAAAIVARLWEAPPADAAAVRDAVAAQLVAAGVAAAAAPDHAAAMVRFAKAARAAEAAFYAARDAVAAHAKRLAPPARGEESGDAAR